MTKAQKMPLSEDFTHKLMLLKQIRVRSATRGTSVITACEGTSLTTEKSLEKPHKPQFKSQQVKSLSFQGFLSSLNI